MVNVNPAYRTHELAYVLEQSEANALILIGKFRNSDYVEMLNEVVPEIREANPGETAQPQVSPTCATLYTSRRTVRVETPKRP